MTATATADARAAIVGRGARHFHAVRGLLGAVETARFLEGLALPKPETAACRVLGFGDALAAFASPPASLVAGTSEAVRRIGAIANLIVSAFDRMIDSGWSPAVALPPQVVRDHLSALQTPSGIGARPAPAPMPLGRLVDWYFAAVRALPSYGHRRHVRLLLAEVVDRMYRAEIATGVSRSPTPGTRLLRVAALPFAAMAVPAWLATGTAAPIEIRRHLRWLYRLGEFVGWIDDVADAVADGRRGQANRYLVAGRGFLGSRSQARALDLVIGRGRRVVAEWRVRPPGKPPVAARRLAEFGACLDSWLAAPRGPKP